MDMGMILVVLTMGGFSLFFTLMIISACKDGLDDDLGKIAFLTGMFGLVFCLVCFSSIFFIPKNKPVNVKVENVR